MMFRTTAVLLLLTGCPWVGPDRFDELIGDLDGDGLRAEDCDDTDASLEASLPRTFYRDFDNDGFGDDAPDAETVQGCTAPAGFAEVNTDCNDGLSAVFPGAEEDCSELDLNCDGDTTAGANRLWFADADGDTFGDPTNSFEGCNPPDDTWTEDGRDCDDTNPLAHPHRVLAGEVCDGIDNDCRNGIDEEDPNIVQDELVFVYADIDTDGVRAATPYDRVCFPDAQEALPGDDCDDNDRSTFPGAQEVCDGVDNNCNSAIDEQPTDALEFYLDRDGDGVGDATVTVTACEVPAGHSALSGDCDDTDPTSATAVTRFLDLDGDGFGGEAVEICGESDTVDNGDDCDDSRDDVHPGATERCNGLDNDCDQLIDNEAVDQVTGFADRDGDGYGVLELLTGCPSADLSIAPESGDCDDDDPETNPNAQEVCGDTPGIDENCNGLADDDDPSVVDASLWFVDNDNDGFGGNIERRSCAPNTGEVLLGNDCNDDDASVFFGDLMVPSLFAGSIDEAIERSSGCTQTVIRVDPDAQLTESERTLHGFPLDAQGGIGSLTIRSTQADRPFDLWIDTSIVADLRVVDAVIQPTSTADVFTLEGSTLTLERVRLQDQVLDGSVVRADLEDFSTTSQLSITDSAFIDIDAAHLASGPNLSLEIQNTQLEGIVTGGAAFQLINFTPTDVNFADVSMEASSLRHNDLAGGFLTVSSPFEIERSEVSLRRTTLTNLEIDAPLFCIQCDGSTPEIPFDLIDTRITDVVATHDGPALLDHQTQSETRLERTFIQSIQGADQPIIRHTGGLTSLTLKQTVLDNVPGGLSTDRSIELIDTTLRQIGASHPGSTAPLFECQMSDCLLDIHTSRILHTSLQIPSPSINACAPEGFIDVRSEGLLVIGDSPFADFDAIDQTTEAVDVGCGGRYRAYFDDVIFHSPTFTLTHASFDNVYTTFGNIEQPLRHTPTGPRPVAQDAESETLSLRHPQPFSDLMDPQSSANLFYVWPSDSLAGQVSSSYQGRDIGTFNPVYDGMNLEQTDAADFDQDGIPDYYEFAVLHQNTCTIPPGSIFIGDNFDDFDAVEDIFAAPNADTDRDTVPDLTEFLMGSDPCDDQSVPPPVLP